MAYTLVTGGSGYVGSHVSKILFEKGYTPLVVDIQANAKPWTCPKWRSVSCQIQDIAQMDKLFREEEIESVIHLAASTTIESSIWNPLSYYHNNITSSLVLLDLCKKYGVKHIVYSSSSSIYGEVDQNDLPTKESHPKNPKTAYGSSKYLVEQMLRDVTINGIKSVSLRYFNASGAAPDSSIGEFRVYPTHLMPRIQAYLEGRLDKIQIHGTDYGTVDGTPVRDYTHVWDIATAHINALEYLKSGGDTISLNIGAGQGRSVLDIVLEFQRQTSRTFAFEYSSRRAGDIPINYADISLAKSVLNWNPVRSDTTTIVEDSLKWYSTNFYKKLRLEYSGPAQGKI